MARVDYNLINMNNCACCICTVQRHVSKCARERTKRIQALEAREIDAISLLKPKEFPWLYCSTGKAKCDDLDFEEECACSECEVWKEYDLGKDDNVDYFCKKMNFRIVS